MSIDYTESCLLFSSQSTSYLQQVVITKMKLLLLKSDVFANWSHKKIFSLVVLYPGFFVGKANSVDIFLLSSEIFIDWHLLVRIT